ncbi:uncharacterized protein [Dermacentor andersoni]|uniref:uncharacterized protein n=1 Tax=Dermacentor andersoni TaxID=34620 RepID=UPI002417FFF6|nr:uncharacterized protein LOC129385011 [Dermacentor andersoni]
MNHKPFLQRRAVCYQRRRIPSLEEECVVRAHVEVSLSLSPAGAVSRNEPCHGASLAALYTSRWFLQLLWTYLARGLRGSEVNPTARGHKDMLYNGKVVTADSLDRALTDARRTWTWPRGKLRSPAKSRRLAYSHYR